MLKGSGPALRAIGALARWRPAAARDLDPGTAPPLPELDDAAGHLSEHESRAVLARYGIDGPRERVAATPDELRRTPPWRSARPSSSSGTGPPTRSAPAESSSAALTPDAAGAAAERIGCPVLVCEDLRGGTELLCGVVRDPQMGPLVVCGIGGSLAEALAETTVAALAPLAAATRRSRSSARARRSAQGLHSDDQLAAAERARRARAPRAHRPDVVAVDINPLRVAGRHRHRARRAHRPRQETTPWISG